MSASDAKLRVLVTGASGFLGSHVCEQLTSAGHQVVALVRRSSKRDLLSRLTGVTFAFGSVEDQVALDEAVRDVDAIIHTAGLVKALSPDEFERVNVRGTEKILRAARARAGHIRRFVHISSLAAIGPSDDGRPVPADRTPRPVTHYGRSKLASERAALPYKDELPLTILRPPLLYGPRDHECYAFFQMVERRVLPLIGGGDTTLSAVYGPDAASACIRALFADVPSGKAYFLDDGQTYVWRDMLAELERALDRRALLRLPIPNALLRGAAFASEKFGKLTSKPVMLTRDKLNELLQAHWVCDGSEARRELDWKPEITWPEGIRLAAAWYRENGWL